MIAPSKVAMDVAADEEGGGGMKWYLEGMFWALFAAIMLAVYAPRILQ